MDQQQTAAGSWKGVCFLRFQGQSAGELYDLYEKDKLKKPDFSRGGRPLNEAAVVFVRG